MNFEEQLMQVVQQKMLKEIKDANLLQGGIPYEMRKQIPGDAITLIWDSINWDEVVEAVRPEIQRRICNTIIGSMETEVKTDVKKLLSVEGVRERLRMEVYPKLMQALSDCPACEMDDGTSSASPAVLPCPFCGDVTPGTAQFGSGGKDWQAFCVNDDCRGGKALEYGYDTEAEAISAWNSRHKPAND